MAYVAGMECCGLREVGDISEHIDPAECIDAIIQSEISYWHEPWLDDDRAWSDKTFKTGALLFTQASPGKYGEILARYIRKHGLGTVQKCQPFLNLNTDNIVTLFVWKVDRKALRKWFDSERPS